MSLKCDVIITLCCASNDGTFIYNFSVTLNVKMKCARNYENLLNFVKVMPKIPVVPFCQDTMYNNSVCVFVCLSACLFTYNSGTSFKIAMVAPGCLGMVLRTKSSRGGREQLYFLHFQGP